MINQEYFIHLIMDNLPCATQFKMPDTQEIQFEPGFRMGFVAKEDDKKYINNHLRFIVSYHQVEGGLADGKPAYRVVGFRVETASVSKDSYEFGTDGGCTIKENAMHQEIVDNKENKWVNEQFIENSDQSIFINKMAPQIPSDIDIVYLWQFLGYISPMKYNGNSLTSNGRQDGIFIWQWLTCRFIGSLL